MGNEFINKLYSYLANKFFEDDIKAKKRYNEMFGEKMKNCKNYGTRPQCKYCKNNRWYL